MSRMLFVFLVVQLLLPCVFQVAAGALQEAPAIAAEDTSKTWAASGSESELEQDTTWVISWGNEGWGEYVDRVNGFTIGYPVECRFVEVMGPMSEREMDARERSGVLYFGDVLRLFSVRFTNWRSPVFSVNIFANPDGLPIEQFAVNEALSSRVYKESDLKVQPMTLGGHKAAKLIYRNLVGVYAGTVTPVYVGRQDRVYKLSLFFPVSVGGKTPSYDELFESILRTFTVL